MIERIYQKIGRIREYIRVVESIREDCISKFSTDAVYRGALLHYLYLLADTCITLAEMAVKHKRLRIPQTYQETFDILGEGGVLDPQFAFSFAKIAGFRNFLAHDYDHVDAAIICKDIVVRLKDVETFLKQIEKGLGLDTG